MIVIFVEEVSERLVYTFDFIFKDREIAYQITNDPVYFEVLEGFKFNYSASHFDTGLQIIPSEVLFSEEIIEYQLQKSLFFQEECLSFNGVTDPIASVFYILVRYEEYLTEKRDIHDRYEASQSIQAKYGWLELCITDRWCEDLISFMEKEYNKPILCKEIPLKFVPTFDVDNVRAYEWKEGIRSLYGLLKDRWNKNTEALKIREEVANKKQKDPFDTFDDIIALKNKQIEPIIFWLIGDFAKYDRNISSLNSRHRALIQNLASKVLVGLHPSYKSNYSTYYLEKEVERMQEILDQEVLFSRQHFLKLSLPYTYQNLINLKVKHDYSMGYASNVGFRAGTARPFLFYDLLKNSITDLTVHSFCYMDATFLDYLNYSVEDSKKMVTQLFQEVTTYGGEFIPLWHNESISNYGKWDGWKELYDYTIALYTN